MTPRGNYTPDPEPGSLSTLYKSDFPTTRLLSELFLEHLEGLKMSSALFRLVNFQITT